MHIFAALLLPPDVLEHARSVVDSVESAAAVSAAGGPAGRHRRGWRRRAEPPPPSGPMLDVLPTAIIHLPIARFGNLSLFDATRLADTMEREAKAWQSPRLHLAGGVALEPEGDDSVWVRLAGDLDELGTVRAGVTRVAQGCQIYVDRRVFRPEVRLATVNDLTTPEHLEAVLAALDGHESAAWWQTTLSLLTPADLGPGRPPFKGFREIPLGPAVPH